MRLEPGALVTDKVRLLHLLREGGMGTVWVGEHVTLETRVAVKFVAAELARKSDSAVERFKREARAAAKLKSPHVVTMLDHGVSDDGIPYIVMELLEGQTLADRLGSGKALGAAEVAAVVAQVAKALDEAHGLGIVHRDIKPSNLFLTRAHDEIFVKVLDFGIAKAMERSDAQLTLTEGMVGTLHYMSPEQMSDASTVGPSADLWSLAVVAYHALTGKLPFDAPSPVAVHKQMTAEAFKPPSERLGRDMPALDEWFHRALAADPADRFGSAREMAAALKRAVGEHPSEDGAERPPSTRDVASSAEMGTAEFLAGVSDEKPAPSSKPKPQEPRTKPSKRDAEADAPGPTMSGHERDDPAPASAVKQRRSLVKGVVLGAAVVALLAIVVLKANVSPPPVPPLPTAAAPLAHPPPQAGEGTGGVVSSAAVPVPSSSASAVPAGVAPSADPFPVHKVWPIGCTATNRPCGLGCCMWDRGCEPGSCEETLPDAEWDVRIAIAAVWQGSDEAKRKPLLDADVWIRFGNKERARQSLFYDRPLRVSTAQLNELMSTWIQPNMPWLPPLIELPPKGYLRSADRLVLCRGVHIKQEVHGNTFWLWLSVSPAGEKPPELCAKVK